MNGENVVNTNLTWTNCNQSLDTSICYMLSKWHSSLLQHSPPPQVQICNVYTWLQECKRRGVVVVVFCYVLFCLFACFFFFRMNTNDKNTNGETRLLLGHMEAMLPGGAFKLKMCTHAWPDVFYKIKILIPHFWGKIPYPYAWIQHGSAAKFCLPESNP